MKKLLALLLACTMVFSLAACSSSSSSEDTASSDETAAESSADAEDTSADTDTDTASDYDFGDVADDPAVTLNVSSAFTSSQLVGSFWEYFANTVEELSGGSVTLTLYLGGTLGGADEELDMLANGSIDMMMCYTPSNAFTIPELNTIFYVPGSIEETEEAVDYVLFENEESSAILEEMFAEYNATMLPAFVVTSNITFISTEEVTCWEDFYSGKFGCPTDACYSDMGYQNLVTVYDTDWYESLRTGLCTSLQVTAGNVTNDKLYEVANYYMVSEAKQVDNWMLINTDVYASLTENQQAVIQAACEMLMDYIAEQQATLTEEMYTVVEENGGTIFDMTEEEYEWFLYCGNVLSWDSAISTLGSSTGTEETMRTVADVVKESFLLYTGYDLDELTEQYAE